MAATSKIRYANKDLEKKHQENVDQQKQPGEGKPRLVPSSSDPKGVSGREFGNDHPTQEENATNESGITDDQDDQEPEPMK